MKHLSDSAKTIRVLSAVAAGTTDQNSDSVDMQGYDAARFVAQLGALTANQVTSLKVQQSSDDGVGDPWADIAGSDSGNLADTDDDGMIIVDIFRPEKRYVRAVVLRGTANAVIDGVIAEIYHARNEPVTQDSTVTKKKTLVNPIAGTA